MATSTPYESTGRTQQKARTRAALVSAARELLAEGVTPTVEWAADRASISRTTAYRYFRNRRALLTATYPDIDLSSLLGPAPPEGVEQRLDLAVKRVLDQVVEHEPELRAQLRLSLEPGSRERGELPFRQGRAIGWLEDALSPLRKDLPERELRDLVVAIRATVGIEALVWLTDVADLSHGEAVEIMRSSARAILKNARA